MEAVTDAGIPQEDEQVIIDTVAVGTATSVTDLDSTPPAFAEKHLVRMDPEITRMYDRHSTQKMIIRMSSKNTQMCLSRFETKCSELLSWVKSWKTSARMLASADPESTPGSSNLLADFKVRLKELI